MSREPFFLLALESRELDGKSLCRDTQIEEQINVLNVDYQTMKIDFKLKSVTRTIKPEWFNVKPDS